MTGYIVGIIVGTALLTMYITYIATTSSIKRKQSELKQYEEEQREIEKNKQAEYYKNRIEKENQNRLKLYEDIDRIETILYDTHQFRESLELYNILNNVDNGLDFYGISEDNEQLKKDLQLVISIKKDEV